jgi:phage gp29-like protein
VQGVPRYAGDTGAPVPDTGRLIMAKRKDNVVQHVKRINKWRDGFNPLRSLTMTRIVGYLEAGERGEYADLQWLYRMVEKRDATIRGLVKRRQSALVKLDWNPKVTPDDMLPAGATKQMADDQVEEIRTTYDRIDNLRQAIKFLSLAEFRGYSHLEKHYDEDGNVVHLEPVEQWHWIRQGLNGEWKYNADATNSQAAGTEIDPANFIIREVDMPINEVAVICFLRKNMSQKDWDGFVEIYGVPPLFATLPQNVPAEKMADYQAMAEAVVGDMRGVLPFGADVKTLETGARNHPFSAHIRYQDEQIVLAGTSGLLTMLNDATGLGSGQSDAHSDTFDDLAEAEAQEISEAFQRNIDDPMLDEKFPNKPHLAYFELAAKDEGDIDGIVGHAEKLSQAGYAIDTEELSEKTGYQLTEKAPTAPTTFRGTTAANRSRDGRGASSPARLPHYQNRADGDDPAMNQLVENSREELARAQAKVLDPVAARIRAVLEIEDPTFFANAIDNLKRDLPELLIQINENPETETVIENTLAAALINGFVEGTLARVA